MSSKTDDIVESIRTAILSHRLLPGFELREMSLSRLYGVSRTVVRQALQRLAKDGLVQLEAGRIAAVAQPTAQEAKDVFDLRIALESHVTMTLIERGSPKDVAQLRTHLRREKAALKAGDWETVRRLGAEFHGLMARLAGNALLTQALEQLQGRVALILQLYHDAYDQHAGCLQEDHERFIDLIEARDGKKALALLRAHLGAVEDSLTMDVADRADDLHLQRALALPAATSREAQPEPVPAAPKRRTTAKRA